MAARLRFFALTVAAVAAILGALTPQSARANLQLTVYIDNGGTYTQILSGSGSTSVSLGNGGTYTAGGTTFDGLTVTANDNVPGSSQGTLNQVSLASNGSSGSGMLVVVANETSQYTSPGSLGTLMILQSNISRADGNTNQNLTFQSWANASVTTGSSSYSVTGGTTPGIQNWSSSALNNVYPNQASTTFTRGSYYTLANVLTLGAGDNNINVNGSTKVITPEPSTMALVGLGALGFTGYGIRRRRARTA